VEIVVTGRNVEVPDHFRVHVSDKLARLERYDHKIIGMEVELFHERNPRQSKSCQRVEITTRGTGSVARAEACASDFYAALDIAIGKLESRMRRMHDRKRPHHGRRSRSLTARLVGIQANGWRGREQVTGRTAVLDEYAEVDVSGEIPDPREPVDLLRRPGRIVRSKVHDATPMTVEDALSRMELVGHDFYLFSDKDSGQPSVVYRRKGYDYGVIRLA
jgi:ribosomal subunit interface protein